MGCGSGSCSCGSGSSGGCGKSNGCATGGCNKLNSFDWLGNMLPPYLHESENVYEVRFKNTRKGFYKNINGLRIQVGDWVVVEGDRGGFDVGQVSLGGLLAQLQMSKKFLSKPSISKLYRKANEQDLQTLAQSREKEQLTLNRSREAIQQLRLDMKLSDVEYQGDGTKATFHYIADARVDFRELIKILARDFKIRVEMKQIGLRHEAGLLGGIGVCGRELCCATWLTEFKVVTTTGARYQNLSLNPAKISGLCGRLKCCLNYELDSYKDALKGFPDVEKFDTEKGMVHLQKTDIFRSKMWFAYEHETTWYALDVALVKEYIAMNRKGKKAPILSNENPEEKELDKDRRKLDFVDVVGNSTVEEEKRNRDNERKKREEQRTKSRGEGKKSPSQGPPIKKQAPSQPSGPKPIGAPRPPEDGQAPIKKKKRKKRPQNRPEGGADERKSGQSPELPPQS